METMGKLSTYEKAKRLLQELFGDNLEYWSWGVEHQTNSAYNPYDGKDYKVSLISFSDDTKVINGVTYGTIVFFSLEDAFPGEIFSIREKLPSKKEILEGKVRSFDAVNLESFMVVTDAFSLDLPSD